MTPDEYRQATRELARSSVMPESVAARMETELDQAFVAGSDLSAGALAKAEDALLPRLRLVALAAAAAVVTAAGGAAWYLRHQSVTSNNVTAVVESAPQPLAIRPVENTSDPTPAPAATSAKPAVRHRRLPLIIRPEGFVPVPTAANLPQFESGVIVRVALPPAALPSYGVDISPASSDRPIEADVLVGQDGLARAIRLVNSSRSQQ